MKAKSLIISLAWMFALSSIVYSQHKQAYTVKGKVLDIDSGKPVAGAVVWMYGHMVGAETDSLGLFEFKVYKSRSRTRVYVRICGNDIADSELVSFERDTLVNTQFLITSQQPDCAPLENWSGSEVILSEATEYEGFLSLDLHGEVFETCSGDYYYPVWTEELKRHQFWTDESQYGDRLYIQIEGQPDPYSKDVVPAQNLLINKLVLAREPEKGDCN